MAINLDNSHIRQMEKKSTDAEKKRRKRLRARRKGFSDKLRENEVDSYQTDAE